MRLEEYHRKLHKLASKYLDEDLSWWLDSLESDTAEVAKRAHEGEWGSMLVYARATGEACEGLHRSSPQLSSSDYWMICYRDLDDFFDEIGSLI